MTDGKGGTEADIKARIGQARRKASMETAKITLTVAHMPSFAAI